MEEGNIFEAGEKIFWEGDYSENGGNHRQLENFETSKKRLPKIYGEIGKKSKQGAANLGSTLGSRHPRP